MGDMALEVILGPLGFCVATGSPEPGYALSNAAVGVDLICELAEECLARGPRMLGGVLDLGVETVRTELGAEATLLGRQRLVKRCASRHDG